MDRARRLLLLPVLALAACKDRTPGVDGFDTGLYVDPSAEVTGLVRAGGAPLAGAFVTTDPHGYEATAGADGRFSLTRLPVGRLRLVVAAAGYDAVTVDAEDGVVVDLARSDPFGRVVVEVLGPDGLPRVGAPVVDSTGQEVQTDEDGIAVLADLGGETVDLVVGDLWPRTIAGLSVPEGGVVRVAVTLSGRPPAAATLLATRVCSMCHWDLGQAYALSPHGRALSGVEGALLARFAAGDVVALAHGTATLGLDGAVPTVTLTAGTSRTFAVTGVIGDARSGAVPFTELGDQAFALPIAWRAGDGSGWAEATDRLVPYDEATWLDADGFTFEDRPDPALSADARCLSCHASGHAIAPRVDGGADLVSRVGTTDRWGEAGVGCEQCHGPGSAHFSTPIGHKATSITLPQRLDRLGANEVCGQCHGRTEALGFPHPFGTGYTPGRVLGDFAGSTEDLWPSGAAASPGQQHDELLVSPHAALRCTDCHEPHGGALRREGDALCAACHTETPRHDGHEEPVACVGCHMPNTAARLDFTLPSGNGDLASHLFVARPPQDAVDVFGSETTLPAGAFPLHGCAECHARLAAAGPFPGPTGDATLRATHEAFQSAFEELFP